MHDYLDHNDCRDKVLARIAKAEAARDLDRARKADARAAKKAKTDAASAMCPEMSARTSAGHPSDFRRKSAL
jgi:hypothetical protein